MPDWQGELESLLATLNVSLEEPATEPGVGKAFDEGASANAQMEHASRSEIDPPAQGTDQTAETFVEVVPGEGDEISAVRSEIEATLREVLVLVRAGRMNRELRDDVVFVLEALTRPRPGNRLGGLRPAGPDDSSTEWNLASAAAVLRFCRIVLRLTNTLARGDDL